MLLVGTWCDDLHVLAAPDGGILRVHRRVGFVDRGHELHPAAQDRVAVVSHGAFYAYFLKKEQDGECNINPGMVSFNTTTVALVDVCI